MSAKLISWYREFYRWPQLFIFIHFILLIDEMTVKFYRISWQRVILWCWNLKIERYLKKITIKWTLYTYNHQVIFIALFASEIGVIRENKLSTVCATYLVRKEIIVLFNNILFIIHSILYLILQSIDYCTVSDVFADWDIFVAFCKFDKLTKRWGSYILRP